MEMIEQREQQIEALKELQQNIADEISMFLGEAINMQTERMLESVVTRSLLEWSQKYWKLVGQYSAFYGFHVNVDPINGTIEIHPNDSLLALIKGTETEFQHRQRDDHGSK